MACEGLREARLFTFLSPLYNAYVMEGGNNYGILLALKGLEC